MTTAKTPAHLDRGTRGGLTPNARVVRSALAAAGLSHLVKRVTSGRNTTYVEPVVAERGDGDYDAWRIDHETACETIADALRPLWIDGARRVHHLGYRVYIERADAWRTPALPAQPELAKPLTPLAWATLVNAVTHHDGHLHLSSHTGTAELIHYGYAVRGIGTLDRWGRTYAETVTAPGTALVAQAVDDQPADA